MLVIATWALIVGRLPIAFVAVSTMVLAFVPMIVARRLGISLPIPFLVATAAFLFGNFTGYCVHSAHASVYLWRSLGLPARIGTGYLV